MQGNGGADGTDRRLDRRGTRGLLATAFLAVALLVFLPGGAGAAVIYPPIAGSANPTATGFELTGTVYNYGGAGATTTYHFEYGATTAYGTSVPMPDATAGPGLASEVSQQVTGLAPNTTYHWRLVSTNSVEGTGFSGDGTFSTAATATMPGESSGAGTPVVGGKGPKQVAKTLKRKGRTLLTAPNGHTLYSLSIEHRGHFVCTATGGCTSIWHPLTVAAGVIPKGPVKLGTVRRPEGVVQITFRGRPLYTFASDRRPGQTKGEGFKDVGTWHAVVVPGAAG